MVVPRADQLLVHRRARHGDGHDRCAPSTAGRSCSPERKPSDERYRLPAPWGEWLDRAGRSPSASRAAATRASPATPRQRAAGQRRRRALALLQVPPAARRADHARPGRQHLGPARRRAQRARPTAAAARAGWSPRARTIAAAWTTTGPPGSAASPASCRSASTTRPSTGRKALDVLGAIIRAKAGLGRLVADTPARLLRQAISVRRRRRGRRRPGRPGGAPRRPRAGAEVVLVDESPSSAARCTCGASTATRRSHERRTAAPRAAGTLPRLRGADRRHLHRPVRRQLAAVIQGNRLYKLRAKAVVVATGCVEQPMVFRNNDLPGRDARLGGAAPDAALGREARPAAPSW